MYDPTTSQQPLPYLQGSVPADTMSHAPLPPVLMTILAPPTLSGILFSQSKVEMKGFRVWSLP